MQRIYQPEKLLWTDADFEIMSWHDCPVHALSFDKNYQLLLDIDYIFKWELKKNERNYRFWIAPCTLVFENVYSVEMSFERTSMIIDSIYRENPRTPQNAEYINRDLEYDWMIETLAGEICFKSVGFKQYVRQVPIMLSEQEISLEIRGGVSFSLDEIKT